MSKPKVHMPDLKREDPAPACGAWSYYPYLTAMPNEVTCESRACRDTALVAAELLNQRPVTMNLERRTLLRRLLRAEEDRE